MAISPSSPPGVQRERLSKRWVAVEGHRWAIRGQLRDREKRVRARSQREQIMAWLASPRFPGDARLRHDGRDPTSRQSAAAQKNETSYPGKNQGTATPTLIRWSIQEIRRIAIRLARKPYPTRTYRRMVHSGAELTKLPLSERTSKQNGNCSARPQAQIRRQHGALFASTCRKSSTSTTRCASENKKRSGARWIGPKIRFHAKGKHFPYRKPGISRREDLSVFG